MGYYHVIAKVGADAKIRCLFSDLSYEELREQFMKPYERGRSCFSGNDLISPYGLASVEVVSTESSDQVEREEINRVDRKRIDEFNRNSFHAVLISVGGGYEPEDIARAGNDITHTLIKGPPGFRSHTLHVSKKVGAWIAGIIATVVATGIAKWLGWI